MSSEVGGRFAFVCHQIARPETLLATSPSSSDNVVDPRADGQTPRRKSVSSKSKAVVTIDQIRPDWEDKLNSVKAQAARRASRRIIMHRVGLGGCVSLWYGRSRRGN